MVQVIEVSSPDRLPETCQPARRDLAVHCQLGEQRAYVILQTDSGLFLTIFLSFLVFLA